VGRQLLSIPYNMFVGVRGQRVGMDAYFWEYVSDPFHRLLMVRRAELLSLEPLGLQLPRRIDYRKQLDDVRSLAALPPKTMNRRPSLWRRLLSLIIPPLLVEEGEEEDREGERMFAWALALELTRMELEPSGEVLWYNLEVDENCRPLNDKLYATLYRRDGRFREHLTTLLCGEKR